MRNSPYLAGHLLIAMPALQDPNFFQTVTYICEHSEEGALGLIINRPLSMDLSSIFEQLSLTSVDPLIGRQQVLQGGQCIRSGASCCMSWRFPRTFL